MSEAIALATGAPSATQVVAHDSATIVWVDLCSVVQRDDD